MPNVKEEIKKLKDAGLKGIKIHPDFVRTFADDNKTAAVINAAAEQGMPVILHGGADRALPQVRRQAPQKSGGVIKYRGRGGGRFRFAGLFFHPHDLGGGDEPELAFRRDECLANQCL